MHSPAELLITDHLGRRTGYEASTGKTLREIPDASAFSDGPLNNLETGLPTSVGNKTLYLPVPDEEPYQLTVVGTGVGNFVLEIEQRDISSRYTTKLLAGFARTGQVEEYRLASSSSGELAVYSNGSLKGGGHIFGAVNRATVTANVSCDGIVAAGTLRFEPTGAGGIITSTIITTATFHNGTANLGGKCMYRGLAHKFRLIVESSRRDTSASLEIRNSLGDVVWEASGPLNGSLRIAE